jgi:GH25 family lysozyme M1 (1,4-beta-N-acetylmuramidase)
MKLKDLIKHLQTLEKEFGELPCIYSRDDEGNGYQAVYYKASTGHFDDDYFDTNSKPINAICIN